MLIWFVAKSPKGTLLCLTARNSKDGAVAAFVSTQGTAWEKAEAKGYEIVEIAVDELIKVRDHQIAS